ncbi:FliM/FliN family flagellar motor C-terminal domain-containing protein [Acidicapsa ligni]|uniref:FliM/FliN family flagellar motor C-terminal domain-containing protein n=1 Tax=Acidicapsa ligni TaxID=542300 RepID=UPI0021E03C37|nr:FliM/FliN family flagellar motor C-terminal domain-containing protein [Acidicapsa ligni]
MNEIGMAGSGKFLECWIDAATGLFAQTLAGEPLLTEALPGLSSAGSFGFVATITGEEQGRFGVMLDGALLEEVLLGEGIDQKAGWGELLKEVANAAAGELLTRTGRKCQVIDFTEMSGETKLSTAFRLQSGERTWTILIRNDVLLAEALIGESADASMDAGTSASGQSYRVPKSVADAPSVLSAGLELLLDIELEATLRFGAREMPLGEILDLGPGDVVQLDRHVNDPVDLIVGDKIVAKGEVVLVNGNFGLRVTEVSEPQRRLESIRCLF